MVCLRGSAGCVLSTALLLVACGDDGAPAVGTGTGTSSSTGEPADSSSTSGADETTAALCEESMSDFQPTALPADLVINIGSSLLTPHPVIQAAFNDVAALYEENGVRVALVASAGYEQVYATEVCDMCGLGPECSDPIAVNADIGTIFPLAAFADNTSNYSCLFRPPGESVRHYVTFTDTEPGPGELMEFEEFLAGELLEADVAFHVAFMLGCSQMEGGMGLVPLAMETGGTSGNICDGAAGVEIFLQGLAAPRVACGFPVADPGPNNSSENLEVTLLDMPSGGEMVMTRVADGLCSEVGEGEPPFEWFVSTIEGVESVRFCPATCGAVQASWEPEQVAFRQTFTCPG